MKKLARALSARIKALRETAGLSQQEVAERGDLSVSLVAKLEQGKKADPRASTLLALAGALDVTPGTLLDDLYARGGQEAAQPPEPERERGPAADGKKPAEGKKKKVDGKKKRGTGGAWRTPGIRA